MDRFAERILKLLNELDSDDIDFQTSANVSSVDPDGADKFRIRRKLRKIDALLDRTDASIEDLVRESDRRVRVVSTDPLEVVVDDGDVDPESVLAGLAIDPPDGEVVVQSNNGITTIGVE